jgi:DNA-binding GntR family transcriptional regulator
VNDLTKNISKQENEISKVNLEGYVELDAQFHEIIARLSESDRLLELTQMLRRHMLRYRIQCIYKIDTALRSMEGHKRILQAIKKADSELVGQAINITLNR